MVTLDRVEILLDKSNRLKEKELTLIIKDALMR